MDDTVNDMREESTGLGDVNWDFWCEMYLQSREIFNAVEEVVAWEDADLADGEDVEEGGDEGGSAGSRRRRPREGGRRAAERRRPRGGCEEEASTSSE